MESVTTICVLISTINEGILRAVCVPATEQEGVSYVVSWQQTRPCTEEETTAALQLEQREDICLTTLRGAGLARNRNHAMETAMQHTRYDAPPSILVLADDDEQFLPEAFERIRAHYLSSSETDIALFRMLSRTDGQPFKRYPSELTDYRRRPRYYFPSSLELTFHSRLVQKGLRFDERFGLGSSKLSGGEEEIFLADALKMGARAFIVPLPICLTDPHTTGTDVLDVKSLRSKGAVYGRLLPPPLTFFRSVREAASLSIRHHKPFGHLFYNIWYGVKYIRS